MKATQFLRQKGIQAETDSDRLCIDIHLAIIEKYGWISVEEYKKIPIPMIFNMLERMEKEYREMERSKMKGGRIGKSK